MSRRALSRTAWFVGLWAAGVASLALVAAALRWGVAAAGLGG